MALTRRQIDEQLEKEKKEESVKATRLTRAEIDAEIATSIEPIKKEEVEAKPKKRRSRAEIDAEIEQEYRAQLEQEMEEARQEQQNAQDRLDFAEAPLAEQLELSVAQVGLSLIHI